MTQVAAFVIAGGQSSRMGRDKAFLELDGRTLLERALELARGVSTNVSIVGSREKYGGIGRNRVTAELQIIEDIYPGQGPLAGIHAALTSSTSELNLMLGVDTPFVEARFLRYLIQEAEKSRAVVTVPVTTPPRPTPARNGAPESVKIRGQLSGGQAQPLCAVYRREFAAVAEEALRQRRNNIVPLFAKVTAREIGDSELRQMAFDPIMFDNLNTPEEWQQACKRAQK